MTHPAAPGAAVTRELMIDGNELRYRLAMVAAGQPLTHHLAATLRRVAG